MSSAKDFTQKDNTESFMPLRGSYRHRSRPHEWNTGARDRLTLSIWARMPSWLLCRVSRSTLLACDVMWSRIELCDPCRCTPACPGDPGEPGPLCCDGEPKLDVRASTLPMLGWRVSMGLGLTGTWGATRHGVITTGTNKQQDRTAAARGTHGGSGHPGHLGRGRLLLRRAGPVALLGVGTFLQPESDHRRAEWLAGRGVGASACACPHPPRRVPGALPPHAGRRSVAVGRDVAVGRVIIVVIVVRAPGVAVRVAVRTRRAWPRRGRRLVVGRARVLQRVRRVVHGVGVQPTGHGQRRGLRKEARRDIRGHHLGHEIAQRRVRRASALRALRVRTALVCNKWTRER